MGLIQGEQENNNYRNFTALDALNIYHAQIFADFDMSIQESLNAKNEELAEIDQWVGSHVSELEGTNPLAGNEGASVKGNAGVFPDDP